MKRKVSCLREIKNLTKLLPKRPNLSFGHFNDSNFGILISSKINKRGIIINYQGKVFYGRRLYGVDNYIKDLKTLHPKVQRKIKQMKRIMKVQLNKFECPNTCIHLNKYILTGNCNEKYTTNQ